jgi:hypothetical protein
MDASGNLARRVGKTQAAAADRADTEDASGRPTRRVRDRPAACDQMTRE